MSLTTHTITIRRRVEGPQDAAGGTTPTYTTAGRGSLDTSRSCRAIAMSTKEKMDHGIRADVTGWKFLIPGDDPSITLQDQIAFDYVSGDSRTVKVIVPSRARSADAAFYKVLGVEDRTEE